MAKQKDEALVKAIAEVLVENPKNVKATRTVNERGVLITLDVHPDDIATIIGKGGRTISLIRQLLKIVGLRNQAWVSLKLVQPEK
jgi:predicted RNA-binding protein YlqC (UPF0109 family)